MNHRPFLRNYSISQPPSFPTIFSVLVFLSSMKSVPEHRVHGSEPQMYEMDVLHSSSLKPYLPLADPEAIGGISARSRWEYRFNAHYPTRITKGLTPDIIRNYYLDRDTLRAPRGPFENDSFSSLHIETVESCNL